MIWWLVGMNKRDVVLFLLSYALWIVVPWAELKHKNGIGKQKDLTLSEPWIFCRQEYFSVTPQTMELDGQSTILSLDNLPTNVPSRDDVLKRTGSVGHCTRPRTQSEHNDRRSSFVSIVDDSRHRMELVVSLVRTRWYVGFYIQIHVYRPLDVNKKIK